MAAEDDFQCNGEPELVDHPAHYGGDAPHEVIKCLEAWGLDDDAYLFNVVKYVARAGKKEGAALVGDLEKAKWYLERKIARLEGNGETHAPTT